MTFPRLKFARSNCTGKSYGVFVAYNGIKCVPIFMKIGQMLQTCIWTYKHGEDDGFIILRLLHVIKNRLGIKAIILWNEH
jgi:hypothetical protein